VAATARRPPVRLISILLAIAVIAALVVVGVGALARGAGSSSSPIAVGGPVPNVSGTTLGGASFDLAALRGKAVVLNFWGPSCIPCRTEFPLLAAKAAAHAADGLVIVGVLTDDPVEPARDFVAQYRATWDTVIDPGGAIKATYRVLGRPQTYFIDRSGILRSIAVGELTDADFESRFAAIAGGG
jgi:cytochrome c biogenesis protein CcmG, thiol:disulfide interchange protein DsbE